MRQLFNFFFIISLLSFASAFLPVSPSCSSIRNGKFYYYPHNSEEKVEIERHDSLQLETNTKTGRLLKCKIIWKDECSYDMYINAFSNAKLHGLDSLIALTPVNVEIIKIEKNFYVCHWDMKLAGRKMQARDTMYFENKIDNN